MQAHQAFLIDTLQDHEPVVPELLITGGSIMSEELAEGRVFPKTLQVIEHSAVLPWLVCGDTAISVVAARLLNRDRREGVSFS
jgi:hypothetical protein